MAFAGVSFEVGAKKREYNIEKTYFNKTEAVKATTNKKQASRRYASMNNLGELGWVKVYEVRRWQEIADRH